jgi:hypothetical protein
MLWRKIWCMYVIPLQSDIYEKGFPPAPTYGWYSAFNTAGISNAPLHHGKTRNSTVSPLEDISPDCGCWNVTAAWWYRTSI